MFYELIKDSEWEPRASAYDLDHYLNWLMAKIFTQEELEEYFTGTTGGFPLSVVVRWDEAGQGGEVYYRSWTVRAWGYCDEEMLDTLAHELTHIAQFMRDRYDGDFEWEGQQFPTDTPYRGRPWEQEAWKAGHNLSREYITMIDVREAA